MMAADMTDEENHTADIVERIHVETMQDIFLRTPKLPSIMTTTYLYPTYNLGVTCVYHPCPICERVMCVRKMTTTALDTSETEVEVDDPERECNQCYEESTYDDDDDDENASASDAEEEDGVY